MCRVGSRNSGACDLPIGLRIELEWNGPLVSFCSKEAIPEREHHTTDIFISCVFLYYAAIRITALILRKTMKSSSPKGN